ncbi:hypothetical protein FKW77_009552 [Venturia effusa]|uniref:Uncharacterized protein n=1 Tax=Venturia effusa TaxID=50376 RepID=A0A517LEM9_9PEZI|nr:hypothetical protein FKW77_009552 [Venturia effusa]
MTRPTDISPAKNDQSSPPQPLPGKFTSLASEHQQQILMESYDPTADCPSGEPWEYTTHFNAIEKWFTILNNTCLKIRPNLAYVKTQWTAQLNAKRLEIASSTWPTLTTAQREAVWVQTRGPRSSPWRRISRKLYILNRDWRFKTSKKYEHLYHEVGSYEAADQQIPCPWDVQARRRGLFGHLVDSGVQADNWVQGPSGMEWEASGARHMPHTWEALAGVADGDVAYIEDCHRVFTEAYRLEEEEWKKTRELSEEEKKTLSFEYF